MVGGTTKLLRLTGILTSRDLLRAVAERTHSAEARVREWMTPNTQVVWPETPAEEAALIVVERGWHSPCKLLRAVVARLLGRKARPASLTKKKATDPLRRITTAFLAAR